MAGFRLVILLLVWLLLGFFAVSSYQQWQFLASPMTQGAPQADKKLNLFRNIKPEQLALDANELRRELQFNSWPDEQNILARQLLKNIKSQIESRPFEGQIWLELINTQHQYAIYGTEFSWNLVNAIRQNRWQRKAFSTLAYHCIHQKNVLSETALNECKSLLSQPFAEKAIGNVRHILGIERNQFEKIVQEARLNP